MTSSSHIGVRLVPYRPLLQRAVPIFVARGELSREEATIADTLFETVGRDAEVVAGVVTQASWDVRLVVRRASDLYFIRPCPPHLKRSRAAQDQFVVAQRLIQSRLATHSGMSQLIDLGGSFLIHRVFSEVTLADGSAAWSKLKRPAQDQATEFVAVLREWFELGVTHGHITPANVGLHRGRIVLLDGCISIFSAEPHRISEIAPELRGGGAVTAAVDLYGAGVVLKQLLGRQASVEERELIDSLLAVEPERRPVFSELERVFLARTRAARTRPVVRLNEREAHTGAIARDVGRPADLIDPETGSVAVDRQPLPKLPDVREEQRPPQALNAGLDVDLGLARELSTGEPLLVRGLIIVAASVVVVLALLLLIRSSNAREPNWYRAFWDSNQESLMVDVAAAALSDTTGAEARYIVERAAGGVEAPKVRSAVLRVGFFAAWRGSLTKADREFLFGIALGAFGGSANLRAGELSELHPAVTLAVLADLPLGVNVQALNELPAAPLSKLPGDIGGAFAALQRLGKFSCGDRVVRGLAKLVTGSDGEESAAAFLAAPYQREQVVQILEPFTARSAGLAGLVLQALLASEESRDVATWFTAEPIAGWKELPPAALVSVIAGSLDRVELQLPQLADLVTFPQVEIRERAATILVKRHLGGEISRTTVSYLISQRSQFSRVQTVSLLSALALRGEAGFALIDRWFEAEPSPQAVFELLLARRSFKSLDPWNVAAARYLIGKEWDASIAQLESLVIHPEPVARALAYSILETSDADQRRILEVAATVEPSPRLRDQVREKLRASR